MKLITVLVLAIASIFATIDARNIESRIVNGADTFAPFYVYLEIYEAIDFTGPIYFGGGTIINQFTILTSAQNVFQWQSWRVGMGANRISDMIWRYSNLSKIHNEYNQDTLANNIAIIHLPHDQWAPINNVNIQILSYYTGPERYPITDTVVNIVGFGFGHTDVQPEVLQKTELTVIIPADCELHYPHLNNNGISESYFCARNRTAASNMCAGDQGGPVYGYIYDKPVLVGIQSFYRIDNCSSTDAQPPAFIRVASYAKWIDEVSQLWNEPEIPLAKEDQMLVEDAGDSIIYSHL